MALVAAVVIALAGQAVAGHRTSHQPASGSTQSKLDAIAAHLVALDDRLSDIEADLDHIEGGLVDHDGRLADLDAEIVPCTPRRWAAGDCERNHPLDTLVTSCLDLHVTADGTLAYKAEPELRGHVGLGWPNVADLNFKGHMQLPLTIGPVAVPSKLGFEGAFGLGLDIVRVCLNGLKIETGGLLGPAAVGTSGVALPGPDRLTDLFLSL